MSYSYFNSSLDSLPSEACQMLILGKKNKFFFLIHKAERVSKYQL